MQNRLKRRLKAGGRALGVWVTLESPIATELLSSIGFDYLVFDTEHSPLDVYQAQTLMQAMRGEGTTCTPIVRVVWNDLVPIKRALDVGAHGVVVPWVNDRAAAEMAVKACRYAPGGLRGCGPRRAALLDPDYLQTADEEILLIAQIETRTAVEHIEEIVAVDGIDVTYIGPADLSASYGHRGDMAHPEVQAAIDRVFDASEAAGVAPGVHMGAGKTIEARVAKGYRLITVGNDLQFLRSSAEATFTRFRG